MTKNILQLSKIDLYQRQHIFFASVYKEDNTPWSDGGKPSPFVVESIKKIKGELKWKRALDIGSGDGRHSVFLRKQGIKVIGIEYQKEAIEKSLGRNHADILYVRGDILQVPLKVSSFDIVIDSGVFHHIRRKDTRLYLEMVSSLMIKGGYMLLICFESGFRHGNGKVYKRGYVFHKGHYDRFSSKDEIESAFGRYFHILSTNKSKEGFLHVLMRRH